VKELQKMAEAPTYALLGGGRWARRIQGILAALGYRVTAIESTPLDRAEARTSYVSRLSLALSASRTRIAWLCDPPGPHTSLLTEAALQAGLHVIVEKPWLCSRSETHSLVTLARAKGLLAGVHYEYCLLDGVEKWRREFNAGRGLFFGGRFTMSRPDHLGMTAIDNLGSHLSAIRAYSVPESRVSEICCGFEQPDERRVWVMKEGLPISHINFLRSKEPIIQRFIAKFEAALEGAEFPFGLDFALRVSDDLHAPKSRGQRRKPA
jgi:hypothetical protein